MTATAAHQRWNRALAWLKAAPKKLWASLKTQWLATALIIPLVMLGVQTYVAQQSAKEARRQSINVDRINKVQDSGKALDVALASYFQAVTELGLAERKIKAPGAFQATSVPAAQVAVVDARKEARKALAVHGGDVQSLRGVLDPQATRQYVSALARVSNTVEDRGDIFSTGRNITALSKLVLARNALVDSAVKRVS